VYATTGTGHLYQGRFKSFVVQNDSHFLTVVRYVEANSLRAGLVGRAEDWAWSSLRVWLDGDRDSMLTAWPVSRPTDWLTYVNRPTPVQELKAMRDSRDAGKPYGDETWTAGVLAARTDARRPRGRPRTQEHRPMSKRRGRRVATYET
jgi:putative transposase